MQNTVFRNKSQQKVHRSGLIVFITLLLGLRECQVADSNFTQVVTSITKRTGSVG